MPEGSEGHRAALLPVEELPVGRAGPGDDEVDVAACAGKTKGLDVGPRKVREQVDIHPPLRRGRLAAVRGHLVEAVGREAGRPALLRRELVVRPDPEADVRDEAVPAVGGEVLGLHGADVPEVHQQGGGAREHVGRGERGRGRRRVLPRALLGDLHDVVRVAAAPRPPVVRLGVPAPHPPGRGGRAAAQGEGGRAQEREAHVARG
mmetsp:Transcript_125499/g.355027  ORF Transcript_125499/g.355027 Transcript_125499/m.355027 type:complete len:205 (+) Transcript_125499:371-985(+)